MNHSNAAQEGVKHLNLMFQMGDGTEILVYDHPLTKEQIIEIYNQGPKVKVMTTGPMKPQPEIPNVISKQDLEKYDDYAATLKTPTNNEAYEGKLIKALIKDNLRLRQIANHG